MGLSGCYALLKYTVFLMNLVFWVCGLTVIMLSVWMFVDPTFSVSMAQDESSYYSGVCIFLLAGILLFVVGVFGCFGTYKESQRLLILFFCGLVLILVAQISAGIWAYSNKDKLQNLLHYTVSNTVQFEYGKPGSQRTAAFDSVQSGLHCCGANGPEDWSSSSWKGDERLLNLSATSQVKLYEIPQSCCSGEYDTDTCKRAVSVYTTAPISEKVIYAEGCSDKLLKKLEEIIRSIIVLTVSVVIVECAGLVISLILCCAVRTITKYK